MGKVNVKKVYINKVDCSNKIEILLEISLPNIKVWENVNFRDMI